MIYPGISWVKYEGKNCNQIQTFNLVSSKPRFQLLSALEYLTLAKQEK